MGLDGLIDPRVRQSIAAIQPGDHICALYEHSLIEQLPAVIAFLKDGLEHGEACIFVNSSLTPDLVTRWLRAHDVYDASELIGGPLKLLTRQDWTVQGSFSLERQADHIYSILDDVAREGYSALRVACDMTWAHRPDLSTADLVRWETGRVQGLAREPLPIRSMCMYGRRPLPSSMVEVALRTHPLLLAEGSIGANNSFRPLGIEVSDAPSWTGEAVS